jgi:hypothetical protein
MSVTTCINPGLIAKNLLIFLVFLFVLSGCGGGSSGSSDSGSGQGGGDNTDTIIKGVVIDIGDEWRYQKGTSALPADWILASFDDTNWLVGNSGIGYGDGDDTEILSDMRNNYSTVYTRKIINYDGSIDINSLIFEIAYDDGFVAYINGQEIARANMPAGEASFDTLASRSSETRAPLVLNLDGFRNLINIGNNVLAIEVHNHSLNSSDLTLLPRLLVNTDDSAPAPTVSLSANLASVVTNGSTTLNWNSTDATDCTASGNWSGNKDTSGSETISALTADSSFSLTCNGPGGSASDSVSVIVVAPDSPLVNLSASPSNLPFNGSTTLSWTSNNISSCTASGDWSGSKGTSGSQTISGLTADSSFSLTCSGSNGSKNDSVSVTVAAPPLPTLSFSANLDSVAQNGSTILNWNTTNATSCTASGDWAGSKSTSGSETISSLTVDRQFTLTCSGPDGTVNDTVNVTVVLNQNGTALLSWTPPTVNSDGSTLVDLAGYKIRYGTSPGNYSDTITINNPGLTSYLVENLASTTWYFVMTSFNSRGIGSSNTTEASKTIN